MRQNYNNIARRIVIANIAICCFLMYVVCCVLFFLFHIIRLENALFPSDMEYNRCRLVCVDNGQ